MTIWRDTDIPHERPDVERVDLTVEGVEFRQPVWMDLLSGRAHRVPKGARHRDGSRWVFTGVPVYDSAIVLADRRAVEVSPVDGPEATRQ